MLNDVIGDLLPFALGVALSPVPIIAIVLVLATPRARVQGSVFAAGWIVGLTAMSVVIVLLAGAIEPSDEPSSLLGWVKLAIGALFLVLAAGQWRSRPAPGEEAATPAWMAALDTMSTGRTAVMGAALSGLNPKNLALILAAAATIGQGGLSDTSTAAAVAVFVVIGSLTVVGPVVFSLVAPSRAAGPLAGIKTFMSQHNAAIMMVILLLLGAKLVGNGLASI